MQKAAKEAARKPRYLTVLSSPPLDLLDADRPEPRRPPGARDRTRIQDGPCEIRTDSSRVDSEVRGVAL